MRFVTLLGLTVVAQCIDPEILRAWINVLSFTLAVGLIVDVIEFIIKINDSE